MLLIYIQLFSYAMDVVFPGVLKQVLMDMFDLDSEEVAILNIHNKYNYAHT